MKLGKCYVYVFNGSDKNESTRMLHVLGDKCREADKDDLRQQGSATCTSYPSTVALFLKKNKFQYVKK